MTAPALSPTDSVERRPLARRLWVAGICALLVRVAAVVVTKTYETNPRPQESGVLAESLLRGEGLIFGSFGTYGASSVETPVQAGLIAAVGLVAEGPWLWLGVMLILAGCGAAAAAVGGRLAWPWGTPAAAVAAFLIALWPTQVLAACVAQPMAACGLLLLGALGLWGRRGHAAWAAGSLCAALAGFWMPTLLPAALLGGLVAAGRNAGRWLIVVVAVLAFWGPWAVRGWRLHEPPVVVTGSLWQDFYEGNNGHATGSAHIHPDDGGGRPLDLLPDERRGQLMGMPEAVRAERFREWGWAFVSENPRRAAELAAVRVAKTLWLDWDDRRALHPAYLVTRTLWLALVAVSVAVCLWRRWRIGPMLAVMAGALVVPALTLARTGPTLAWEPVGLLLIAIALAGQPPTAPRSRDRFNV